eukprot:UN33496
MGVFVPALLLFIITIFCLASLLYYWRTQEETEADANTQTPRGNGQTTMFVNLDMDIRGVPRKYVEEMEKKDYKEFNLINEKTRMRAKSTDSQRSIGEIDDEGVRTSTRPVTGSMDNLDGGMPTPANMTSTTSDPTSVDNWPDKVDKIDMQ